MSLRCILKEVKKSELDALTDEISVRLGILRFNDTLSVLDYCGKCVEIVLDRFFGVKKSYLNKILKEIVVRFCFRLLKTRNNEIIINNREKYILNKHLKIELIDKYKKVKKRDKSHIIGDDLKSE
jgi:hypothetical protein